MRYRSSGFIVLAALLCIFGPAAFPAGKGKVAGTKTSLLRNDPKCVFLRTELARTSKEAREFAEESPSNVDSVSETNSTITDLAARVATSEVYAAKEAVLRAKCASCERGESLSSLDRLTVLENTRTRHIAAARNRWVKMGGSEEDFATIAKQLNDYYDHESQSFYNPDRVAGSLDRDVSKDYPDLIAVVDASAIPPDQKEFLKTNSKFIRYEEGGRLYNTLRGVYPEQGTGYVYVLRSELAKRAKQAQDVASAQARAQQAASFADLRSWLVGGLIFGLLLIPAVAYLSYSHAKYKAFKQSLQRVPVWFGAAELVLWNPGETVIILNHKKLVRFEHERKKRGLVARLQGQVFEDAAPEGGYAVISAFLGQEYKGLITSKTKLMTWPSDELHTSNGVPVRLTVAVLWRIGNRNLYVSRISDEFHQGSDILGHGKTQQGEVAELWIRTLAASTLRQQLSQLPAERVVSSHVEDFMLRPLLASGNLALAPSTNVTPTMHTPIQQQAERQLTSTPEVIQVQRRAFSEFLADAHATLTSKLTPYGIEIEHVEVQKIDLPDDFQEELELLQKAFVQALRAVPETRAKALSVQELEKARAVALEERARILGPRMAGLIEMFKNMQFANVVPYAGVGPGMPLPGAIINTVNVAADEAVSGKSDKRGPSDDKGNEGKVDTAGAA